MRDSGSCCENFSCLILWNLKLATQNFVGIYPNGFELGQKFQCSLHMEKLCADGLINFLECCETWRVELESQKSSQIATTNLILQFRVLTDSFFIVGWEFSTFNFISFTIHALLTFLIQFHRKFQTRNFINFTRCMFLCT